MNKRYIVSMTTYYPRFQYAHLAIESILAQKCPYQYDFHLYLSKKDIDKNGGVIPSKIKALIKHGLKIYIKEEDIRSYKKLVYAYLENSEKTIITVDDDAIYPIRFLYILIQKSHEFPGCIVCFRGHFFSFDTKGELLPYLEMVNIKHDDGKRIIPSFCLLPTGVSGILYPPDSLDESVLDKEQFNHLCPYNDDI